MLIIVVMIVMTVKGSLMEILPQMSAEYVTMTLLMTVCKMSVAFGVDQVIQMCAEYVTRILLMTVFKMNVVFGVE
jgi:N-acyl-L-homoserine lactone synthetase